MSLLSIQGAALLIWVLSLAPISPTAAQSGNSKPGCDDKCGNLTIPYPFGLTSQEDCYLADGNAFVVYCNETVNPPVAYWQNQSTNIRIQNISIVDHEMQILVYVARDCYNESGRVYWNNPHLLINRFAISNTRNTFTAVGCDTYAVLNGNNKNANGIATGCLSSCHNISDVTDGACSGIGCCQGIIPRNVMQYKISLSSYNNHSDVLEFNNCSYAFVAVNDYFNLSINSLREIKDEMVPLIMDWAIGNETCTVAQGNQTSYACKGNTTCKETINGIGYRCHCMEGYQGNPYLSGCQDIDECVTSNPCNVTSLCTNLLGNYMCSCPKGYYGDGLKTGSGCSTSSPKGNPMNSSTGDKALGLGVGVGCGMVLLFAFWAIQKKKQMREREKFFNENGGLMLQRLISQHRSGIDILKVFTVEELKKATNNFHESRILGQGGQGTVYRGTMMNKVVAIKKAKHVDRSQVNDFINEVIVLSQINHKNVVKLIGCCLETELPLLVYEFVTNGTLSEHLHDADRCSTALSSWGDRLRVAVEAAGALSYLHSDAVIPIYHRDVKSANILLDENYTTKVSDFGASRVIPVDQSQLSTLVQGTFGYIDPEYFHTSQLTEKSDVYSFGVVLAELLTGMKAISFDKPEKDRNLSLFFVTAVKDGRVLEIIDKRFLNEGNVDHIREVALLASRCLKVRGEDRPSMKEVALQLEGLLRATDTHPWTSHPEKENFQENEYLLGDGYMNSADTGAVSITVSEDTTKSQIQHFHIADAR